MMASGWFAKPSPSEKGMLSEGGIHVPYLVAWPGVIPAGQEYSHPISTLDVAATAAAIAGIETEPGELDGVDLIPFLKGEQDAPPHEALFWRWSAQAAVRQGDWKLLRGGNREYLYHLGEDIEEQNNLIAAHPEIADRLRMRLKHWTDELEPAGLAVGPMSQTWHHYFDFYLEGKPAPPLRGKFASAVPEAADTDGWIARNAILTATDGVWRVAADPITKSKNPFLTKSGLKLVGPVTARVSLLSRKAGQLAIAWRTDGERDFQTGNRVVVDLEGHPDWQTHEIKLPVEGTAIHLRLHLPAVPTTIRTP